MFFVLFFFVVVFLFFVFFLLLLFLVVVSFFFFFFLPKAFLSFCENPVISLFYKFIRELSKFKLNMILQNCFRNYVLVQAVKCFTIGIKHGFPCINIC